MNLGNLRPAKGARQLKKRVGRGQGTGLGKTCGRGSNGQNSRSGGGTRPGFEGGQMPLMRRIPKRGFSNYSFKKEYAVLNIKDIADKFDAKDEISIEDFYASKIVKKGSLIKILGVGDITKAKTVNAHAFAKSAKEKIEKAGGKAIVQK
ncbi:MAG: 50S ribosomal protein L15 [Elusimicrobiota bacterium]